MLHIHNGDASANVLRESNLPGDHLPWREALLAGPTPGGLAIEEWIDLRADHLSRAYDADRDECRADLQRQEEKLRGAIDQDEIVLWFEHDLSCQTILIYLLDRFARLDLGETPVSLICIDHFPGIDDFRGLGQLTPEQMASLFDLRQPITSLHLSLGAEAWRAYTSSDPTAIERFLLHDTSLLPLLSPALNAHLERFPSAVNGLGFVENRALELIDAGLDAFDAIFNEFSATEAIYGYGDYQLWNDLRLLAEAPTPLLAIDTSDRANGSSKPVSFKNTSFTLTDAGVEVFAGERDAIELNGIDTWLGGVHLTHNTLWRWDEEHERLMGRM